MSLNKRLIAGGGAPFVASENFKAVTYTGNGGSQAITGLGFQPDFVWTKRRSGTDNHMAFDTVRGASTSRLYPNLTNAADGNFGCINSFDTDGFTLGTNVGTNANNETFASWNWKANGAGSANTDGSINSTVSVNTSAGFSIVKFTGTGANATVGHGLGAVPKMMLFKNLEQGTEGWMVYHEGMGNTKKLNLDSNTGSSTSSTFWQDTTPTSSVFSVGSNHGMNGTDDMIAYCFAEKVGYSKFGKYSGNNNADGTFVYTGFKPAFVMMKVHDGVSDWSIFDNKRLGYNTSNRNLKPNSTAADETIDIDLLSNGFKPRTTSDKVNNGNYIFMAFGQSLVGSNNVPCTAR